MVRAVRPPRLDYNPLPGAAALSTFEEMVLTAVGYARPEGDDTGAAQITGGFGATSARAPGR